MIYNLHNKHTGTDLPRSFPDLVEMFGFQYAQAIHRLSVKHGKFESTSYIITNSGHDEGFKPALRYAAHLGL